MKFLDLSNGIKCVCAGVITVATIGALAIGFDYKYAKAATQREMQKQMYVMQLSININEYQRQIDYLRSQPQTHATKAQIAWLQREILKMQQQMMSK